MAKKVTGYIKLQIPAAKASIDAAISMIAGTARSMGITVED